MRRRGSRRPEVTLAAALLALALPWTLAAQAPTPPGDEDTPLVGDRPDITESALAVTRLQLEAGYTFEDGPGAKTHTAGELLVRVPAPPGWR